jgi:hypothetical protein
MMYSFPARWTLDGFSAPENNVLSAIDKQFIGSAGGYPKSTSPTGPKTLTVGDAAEKADVGKPGEEDLFQFNADQAGRYVIETTGSTDVFMSLYGPNSQTTLVGRDDDSGGGFNAKLVKDLAVGTYVVQIRHYSETGTGSYGIKVNLQ